MKYGERFIKTYKQGGEIRGNLIEIWVDTETGVNYVLVKNGYGIQFNPLIDENGKPIVTQTDLIREFKK